MGEHRKHRTPSETESSLEVNKLSEEDDPDDDLEFEDLHLLGSLRGVLTMNIQNCRGLDISVQCFIRISVGETTKCTKLQSLTEINEAERHVSICFNEQKYFSVQISNQKSNAVNPEINPDCEPMKIVVEFFVFKPEARDPTFMGKDFLNLVEIFNQSVTHQFSLMLNKQVICELDVEMALTYGAFGYGYSHLHPEKTLEDLVDKSLFPRCLPLDDCRDSHNNVITLQPTARFNFLSLVIHKRPFRVGSPMDQIQKRGRLLKLYKAQKKCKTDEEVVQFLEKVVMKKTQPEH